MQGLKYIKRSDVSAYEQNNSSSLKYSETLPQNWPNQLMLKVLCMLTSPCKKTMPFNSFFIR